MVPGRLGMAGIKRAVGYALGMQFRHVFNEIFGEPNTYTTIFVYAFAKADR